jgi:uncharacterized membrane protein YadS
MCAVLLGMLWRNSIGVPAWATAGLNWTMHRLLRVGIALVGLRLTWGRHGDRRHRAAGGAGVLAVALGGSIAVSRTLGCRGAWGYLLAISTAVCGCTAVVAMSP